MRARGRAAAAVVLLAAAACSSPTAPSNPPPVTSPPPSGTPPLTITCPSSVSATGTAGSTSVNVSFGAPTVTGGTAPVQVSCTRPSGSAFPMGSTTVQCTATDAARASVSCSFGVSVTIPAPRILRTRFLAFGDSLTAGEVTAPTSGTTRAGTPNYTLIIVPAASYPTQLLQLLRTRYYDQASLFDVFNEGKSGEWAQDGVLRLPTVLASRRPEAVLILEGINDLGASGSVGIAAAASSIDRMAKESRARGARVFLSTLPPPGPAGAKGVPASQVLQLNDRIRTIAAGEGAVLVDTYAAMLSEASRYVGIDGLHLTEVGYQKLAELFFTAIRGDLELR